jgi:hypothetical protein
MRDFPSPALIELLKRLHLAEPLQVAGVAREVRRLAGGLPHFDSVWIDALAQDGRLTPYQASEINAGRGDSLLIGQYVVCDRLPTHGYAACYHARSPETGESVKLLVAATEARDADRIKGQLAALVEASRLTSGEFMCEVNDYAVEPPRTWLAAPLMKGISAADWIVENGRFPPFVALHLARQMVSGLAQLERRGLLHGDLHVRHLTLRSDGIVAMSHAGARPVLRPEEGFALVDLPPEAYESLAPERVVEGAQHDVASELFACGSVWWHLLTGRPAIVGGNSLAKLRAAAEAKIPDVRQFAPDAPPVLAETIAACVNRNPAARPSSLMDVAQILGTPTMAGQKAIAHALESPDRWLFPRHRQIRQKSRRAGHVVELVVAATCVAIAVGGWWLLRGRTESTPTHSKVTIAHAQEAKSREKKSAERPALIPVRNGKRDVEHASFVERGNDLSMRRAEIPPLLLPVGRVVRLESLSPRAGQVVCGKNDARTLISVPAAGLVIEQPDVCFRNIDFVSDDKLTANRSALVVVRSPTVEFDRCSFQSLHNAEPRTCTAIRWLSASNAQSDTWQAADDQLKLSNCVFLRVDTALERNRPGDASVECLNCLHISSGTLVRNIASAEGSDLMSITLDHCTLRNSGPAFEILPQNVEASADPARVTCAAIDCVFAIESEQSLVLVDAGSEPNSTSPRVRWTGQGSLVSVDTPLVGSRLEDGGIEPLAESIMPVTGLARSQLEFAGDVGMDPQTSKLLRWLAPRPSLDPPGIVPSELNLPEFP